ncbi:hypothetical protein BYT27DRAFT_7118545 [Phlegmacium glaucopus]|nr:hypothetical protein BYT27DRAFT_7118545 [Phlegmacium glaucopus]
MFEHINPTLVLQNSGSVARDHLASERTFLAYVRTSIGLAVAGVGIVQLFTVAELTSTAAGTSGPEVNRSLQRFGISLGVLALTFALFVLCFGVYRFFVVQRALPKNMFPAAQLSIVAISFVFGAIVVVLFAVLLTEKLAFFSAGVE